MRHTRIKLPSPASYHVTTRVKDDEYILAYDEDKRDLLGIIRRVSEFAGVTVMSHSILDNHFHLLVRIPERKDVGDAELERRLRVLWGAEKADAQIERWRFWEAHGKAQLADKERAALRRRMYDITPFMKTIKELFMHSFNRRHGTCGAVWGRERFKSAAVAQDFATLATVAAYIDLNAVRARLATHPKKYKWCGFGAANIGDSLSLDGITAMLDAANAASEMRQNPSSEVEKTHPDRETGKPRHDSNCEADDASQNTDRKSLEQRKKTRREAALKEYAAFLEWTRNGARNKRDIPIFKSEAEKTVGDADAGRTRGEGSKHTRGEYNTDSRDKRNINLRNDENAFSRGGYIRKTLDSADLTRLGADGVARWLDASELKPESASEMWKRRVGNIVVGGILGPLAFVLEARSMLDPRASSKRWQPGMVDWVFSFISERNKKARSRNAS